MKRAISLVGAVVMCCAALGENLLRSEFLGDGIGGCLDWGISRSTGGVSAELLPAAGPEGAHAVRLSSTGKTEFTFAHLQLRLVAGERYRLTAWVRTKGLNAQDRAEFLVYNYGWSRSCTAKLPLDTAGAWRQVAWEGEMCASEKGIYTCAFYFSRLPPGACVDICNPRLEPLSARAAEGASKKPATAPFKGRLVPIDPLLADLDAADAKMTFYYPGDLAGELSRYEVRAAFAGREARAPLGADRHATVSFGSVPAGRHALSVRLVETSGGGEVASNDYSAVARARHAYPAEAKRLNNFVTELWTKPLADGAHAFTNPREGWVFVGFDKPYEGVSADLDGIADAICFRAHEPSETMRWLPPGRHTLTVRGVSGAAAEGRVSVRLVKTIAHSGGRLSNATTDFPAYRYGRDFYREWLYDFFNTVSGGPVKGANPGLDAELAARGKFHQSGLGIQCGDPVRNDQERLLARITNCPAYRVGMPFTVDENSIGAAPLMKYNYAEAAWRAFRPECRIGMFWNDAVRNGFGDPRINASEVSAVLNSGDGLAMMYPEVYLRAMEDERDALAQIDHWKAFADSARRLMPIAPSRIIYYLGGWLMMGQWSPYYCPEADMKALYADFLHALATDPAFADAGGVGFSCPSCNENLFRFAARAIRYYCIEGGTEKLSARYGLTYLPGHMSNGDFTDGFAGWAPQEAEPGSLTVGHKRGFGRNGEMRKYGVNKDPKAAYGDDFAVFRRSARAPNLLRRTLANLVPGRVYELMYCSADFEDVMAPAGNAPETWTLSATLTDAETIPALSFDHVSRMLASDRARGAKIPNIVTHRVVFRAKAATATLTFSDWRSATEPGGAAGEKRILNFVGVRPYYAESESDLADFIRFVEKTQRSRCPPPSKAASAKE